MEMLWIAHTRGTKPALAYINEMVEIMRDRASLTFLTAASGRAALERCAYGAIGAESIALLDDVRWAQIPGRRALLQAEGLYPG
jgi:hypothetical protein